MSASSGLSPDATRPAKAKRSKIYISIVYLWTARGPEINNGCVGGDRARSPPGSLQRGMVVAVARGNVRRRSRQAVSRPRVVQFSLTEEEFDEVSKAAERSGLARGAFAAEAALASARGGEARMLSPLREALVELIAAAGLVRRAGTNLNQAVAKLNATGQCGGDLLPAAQFCVRVIRRLDDAAEHVRRSVP
jgi:hypothetical protein